MYDYLIEGEYHSPDDKQVLRVYLDPGSAENPRTDDYNIATLFCEQEEMGDTHQFSEIEDLDLGAQLAWLNKESLVSLPIYVVEHGGITMRTESFAGGLVGIAYATKERIAENSMESLTSEQLKEKIKKEVDDWNLFNNGEVYAFSVFDKSVCDQGKIHFKETMHKSGILGEDAMKKAIDFIDAGSWVKKAPVQQSPNNPLPLSAQNARESDFETSMGQ